MHLSLKSSLGRQILTGIYVKDNRVLDLTTPFSELTFTLDDRSGEGNDATLYTGRYISTDGSTDRGIVADCSAAGAGNYYLTGKVRPNAVTTAELTMDGSTDSGLTGLMADVWQTFTTATSAVTPSAVQVGYDGSTASAADWSDVRLIDSSDGSTVARWQLNESADGDLNGYPALDSSGNGYHGTHTGCAGGTGEGIDADVAGAAFAANEDNMWFGGSGSGDFIDCGTKTGNFYEVEVDFYTPVAIDKTSSPQGLFCWNDAGSATAIYLGGGTGTLTDEVIWLGDGLTRTGVANITIPAGNNTIKVLWNGSTEYNIFLNGVSQTLIKNSGGVLLNAYGDVSIGSATSAPSVEFKGIIQEVTLRDASSVDINNWVNGGNTDADWLDQIGSNNGTVNGNPVTVGQKRATILQTAGMDWNKAWTFDGDDSSYATYGSALIPAASDFSIVLYVLHRNGSTSSLKDIVSQYRDSEVGRFLLNCRNNNVRLFIGQSGGNVDVEGGSFTPNVIHKVEVTRVGDLFTLLVDDFEVGTVTVAGSISVLNPTWVGESLASGGRNLDGFVAGYINGVSVGDFTKVGTTASNYLIPASDATPTNDALGNAIAEPRPTADTWNLFGDGEYGRVADADSLDVTTEATWEIWGNFYGVPAANQSFFTKYQVASSKRSWLFSKNASQPADKIVFNVSNDGNFPGLGVIDGAQDKIQCLSVTLSGGVYVAYLDAQVTTLTGAIDTTIFASDVPVIIGAQNDMPSDPNYASLKISRPKIYNRAFTADEVLKNYNAQKGAFGL